MLNEGWRDQYARMHRAHKRLTVLCGTATDVGSDEARDALYRFFEEAYKLKDWIKFGGPKRRYGRAVERLINRSIALAACADIANGIKHLHLHGQARTAGGQHAQIVTQGVTIFAPPAAAEIHSDGTVTHLESTGGATQHTWTIVAIMALFMTRLIWPMLP
ncbi:hypothetical protein AB0M45_24715 [Nocardia sp. NPDC051787]|uniref:hypothetical protein n=1 Tax=Nocardia sp. NPDC051787 TaxID=3155415 RepID=UPI00341C8E9B